MISVFISWFIIFIQVILWGIGTKSVVQKVCGENCDRKHTWKPDLIVMLGFCFLTAYAQLYSLFGGLNLWSNVIMWGIDIIILISVMKKWKKNASSGFSKITENAKKTSRIYLIRNILCVIILLAMAYYGAGKNYHVDTDLYHGQAIHWLEDYGVVKGLGNLYNRLAYNSSFLCLQALFSMKYLFGQSLRSINCLMIALFDCYCICHILNPEKWFNADEKDSSQANSALKTCKRGQPLAKGKEYLQTNPSQKIRLSDWVCILGLCAMAFIQYLGEGTSSACTDFLPAILVLYILIKLIDQIEQKENDLILLCLLSVLGVWTVTVKLSSICIVIIVIPALAELLKSKKYKEIIFFLLLGTSLILPFIIRNILISGYLLYPYAGIDWFNVPWKMSREVLEADAREIMVYGRNLQNYYELLADMEAAAKLPFTQWFPMYFANLGLFLKCFCLLDIAAFFFAVGYALYMLRNRDYARLGLSVVVISGYSMWMLSAPLARYGVPWMIGICIPLMSALLHGMATAPTLEKIEQKMVYPALLLSIAITVIALKKGAGSLIGQIDYRTFEVMSYSVDGVTIYAPLDSFGYVGYHELPGTDSIVRLEHIGLLGKDMEDGFYYKNN